MVQHNKWARFEFVSKNVTALTLLCCKWSISYFELASNSAKIA